MQTQKRPPIKAAKVEGDNVGVIGWVGALCFSLCAVPQAWTCYRQGHADGVSGWFLFLWVTGEICTLAYVVADVPSLQLIVNYLFNLACLVIILKYKVFPQLK